MPDKSAAFALFRDGTRLALAELMLHSSSVASAGSILIATLSLCSLAHAQEPLPAAPPSETTPAASEAPAASEVAPVPPPALAAPAPAPAATNDDLTLRLPTRVHQGFYLRFTSGPSFLTLRGHGPSGSPASITDGGASGSIAIGGAIVPGLVLAGTLQGTAFNSEFKGGPFADATVSANGQTRSASHDAEGGFGMIGLLVDWYPKPTGNWHAGFATGLGAVGLTNSADDSGLGGVNFAGSVFGGYDWTLGRNWALGLQLTASGATTTKLMEDHDSHDSHDSGYRLTPFSVGVQASLLYF